MLFVLVVVLVLWFLLQTDVIKTSPENKEKTIHILKIVAIVVGAIIAFLFVLGLITGASLMFH